jgi:co-chaperonin GroES (HSP10)
MTCRLVLVLFLCQWVTQASPSSPHAVKFHSVLQNPRPFRDFVITESKLIKRSQNGLQQLHVPSQVKETLAVGKVLGVGPGEKMLSGKFYPTHTQLEEFVIYPTTTAKFSVNGISHDLLHEGDILLKCQSFEPKLEEVNCFGDHLLVEVLPSDQSLNNGEVITPNSRQTKFSLAKVIKVGPPYRFFEEEKVDISPGDRILISNEGPRYSIALEGKIYELLHVQDVFAAL